jgi:hypothetical protein
MTPNFGLYKQVKMTANTDAQFWSVYASQADTANTNAQF